MPDAVNVLDGVADLLPQLLLVELHLGKRKTQRTEESEYRESCSHIFIDPFKSLLIVLACQLIKFLPLIINFCK